MGNSQSHAYADRQRAAWIQNSPNPKLRPDALRRTRSPTDDFMPEFGYTPSPHGRQIPRTNPTLAGSTLASSNNGRSAPNEAEAPNVHGGHRIEPTGTMPPSPARDTCDGHVHFEGESVRGIHDHSHDRPRTPYPESSDRARRVGREKVENDSSTQ